MLYAPQFEKEEIELNSLKNISMQNEGFVWQLSFFRLTKCGLLISGRKKLHISSFLDKENNKSRFLDEENNKSRFLDEEKYFHQEV